MANSKKSDKAADDGMGYDDYYNEGDTVLKNSANIDDNVLIPLNEGSNYPKLTQEEEVALAKKAFNGDKSAEEILILSNLGLVYHIAKRFVTPEIESSELVSEGFLGLVKAVQRFDPSKGYKLSTYAGKSIENAMKTAINREKRASNGTTSLDRALEENGDTILGQVTEDSCGMTTKDIADSAIQTEHAEELCSDLTPVERRVARLLSGLEDGKKWSVKAIQRESGFTEYRIREIKKIIKEKVGIQIE